MKKTWLFFFLLLTSCTLFAQQTGLDLLKSYRIPETRYRIGDLVISTDMKAYKYWKKTNFSKEFRRFSTNSYNYNIRPGYTMVDEQDDSFSSIFFSPSVTMMEGYLDAKNGESNGYSSNNFNYEWQKNIGMRSNIQFRNYPDSRSDNFFYATADVDLGINHQYERNYYENNWGSKSWVSDYFRETTQSYTNTFMLGFGRIREVTSVIHALRYSERLQQIGGISQPLSVESINRLTEVFSRYQAYDVINDRPEKLVRGAVDEIFTNHPEYSKANGFQRDYAFEALSENRFIRREGTVFQFGLLSVYESIGNYSEEKDLLFKNRQEIKTIREDWVLAFLVNFMSNQSITLNSGYMISVFSSAGPQVSEMGTFRQSSRLGINAGWFYESFDRFLVSIENQFIYYHYNLESIRNYWGEKFYPVNYGNENVLKVSTLYFVENNTSLNLIGEWAHIHEKSKIGSDLRKLGFSDLNLRIGLTYYFYRSLLAGFKPFELNP